MSIDATKILEVSCYFMYLWSTPLTAIVCIALLIDVAGIPGLAGLAVMILMVPLSGWLGSLIGKLQRELMKKQDSRISAINEVHHSLQSYFKESGSSRKACPNDSFLLGNRDLRRKSAS
jgi:ATP-binding cassette, subfamily C (CFTR/MRP), member 1